jgi:Arc/MetJ-type ribon-helix-helix transcriptional regulator
MAADGGKLVQKTFRLPPSVVEFVEALRKSRILGHTESEVVRSLLETAISNLIRDDYVRKYQETLKALRNE